MRLRQIVLVADDLDGVVQAFSEVFGWRVAYRDPIVAKWGLRNVVIPIGDEFLEVVSPVADGTSAGRHMARIGGDGGYMLMAQVDDRNAQTARLEQAGVRVAYRSDQETYCLTQFHPADCGGLMLSWEQVLHPDGADWRKPDGYWHAAHGDGWQALRATDRVGSMRKVVLVGERPETMAETYAGLLDLPVTHDGEGPLFRLPGSGPAIGFVRGSGSPIARIDLAARDAGAVLEAARKLNLVHRENEIMIAGVRWRLT